MSITGALKGTFLGLTVDRAIRLVRDHARRAEELHLRYGAPPSRLRPGRCNRDEVQDLVRLNRREAYCRGRADALRALRDQLNAVSHQLKRDNAAFGLGVEAILTGEFRVTTPVRTFGRAIGGKWVDNYSTRYRYRFRRKGDPRWKEYSSSGSFPNRHQATRAAAVHVGRILRSERRRKK